MSRALALLRILLGVAVLADLARWLPDFSYFFTNQGVLTLSGMVTDTQVGRDAFSLYNACSYSLFPYLLLLATALAAGAVTAGTRCQRSVPALWVLLLSLQNRAAVALDLWDTALLVALAVGWALPWDEVWAYRPSRSPNRAGWIVGGVMGSVLLASQVSPSPWTTEAAAFLALGPRAHPSSAYWYVVVGVDKDGRRWDLCSLEGREPDFSRPAHSPLDDSYRKRLYLGGLRQDQNWGLRYWLAFRYFVDFQATVRSVEVYQCQESEHHLFSRWPMQGESPPQGSAATARKELKP